MLLIDCPWCGPREEMEFHYGFEAGIAIPPTAADDRGWARYLFYRSNPIGPYRERWFHAHGCRRWFTVTRDTNSHEMSNPRPIGPAE